MGGGLTGVAYTGQAQSTPTPLHDSGLVEVFEYISEALPGAHCVLLCISLSTGVPPLSALPPAMFNPMPCSIGVEFVGTHATKCTSVALCSALDQNLLSPSLPRS